MKTIALIAAVPIETTYFFKNFDLKKVIKVNRIYYEFMIGDKRAVLTHSHAGPVNASSSAEAIIVHYSPSVVINFGSAGSHSQDILLGDIVIGTKYTSNYNVFDETSGLVKKKKGSLLRFFKGDLEEGHDAIDADPYMLGLSKKLSSKLKINPIISKEEWYKDIIYRDPMVHFTVIGSEDSWTTNIDLIKAKKEKFSHEAEDKESAYIAQICYIHNIAFLSIRGISDNELLRQTQGYELVNIDIEKCSINASKLVEQIIKNF